MRGIFLQRPDDFRCMEVPFPERGQASTWGAIRHVPCSERNRLQAAATWVAVGSFWMSARMYHTEFRICVDSYTKCSLFLGKSKERFRSKFLRVERAGYLTMLFKNQQNLQMTIIN